MKRILITGATSGIAIACARIWAAQGSQFVLVGRDAVRLEQTAADLLARGAYSVQCLIQDLNQVDQHPLVVERAVLILQQIDIALVAQGVLPDQAHCEQDMPAALQAFHANATAVLGLLTCLAAQFERQRCGSLAVISSVAGDRGRPSNYVYGSAKAAVSAFCEGLGARLFKKGVHLMTIKPGFVDTPMTQGLNLPARLVASADQVARDIVLGVEKKRAVLYTPVFWKYIMWVVCAIPQVIFKRLSL